MEDKKFIDLAIKICANNPTAIIGGSLALRLQGLNIRRPIGDLDIEVNDPEAFVRIEGMRVKEVESEEDYNRNYDTYLYGDEGIKINVFDCLTRSESNYANNLPVQQPLNIFKHKLSYCAGSSPSSDKHRLDIIYYLMNNK